MSLTITPRPATEAEIIETGEKRGAEMKIENGRVKFRNPGFKWADGGDVKDYLYAPEMGGAFKVKRNHD